MKYILFINVLEDIIIYQNNVNTDVHGTNKTEFDTSQIEVNLKKTFTNRLKISSKGCLVGDYYCHSINEDKRKFPKIMIKTVTVYCLLQLFIFESTDGRSGVIQETR